MNKVELYWKQFTSANSEYKNKEYTAWHFDNNEKNTNHLAELVIKKVKQATASLYEGFTFDTEKVPETGDISIILDWNAIPKCIIETTIAEHVKFKDVTAEFAYIEGEGDKSLKYWQEAHTYFFTDEALRIGTQFTENSLIVCEQFKLIYT